MSSSSVGIPSSHYYPPKCAQEVSNTIWGMARLQWRLGHGVGKALETHVSTSCTQRTMKPQAVSNILWGFAVVLHRPQPSTLKVLSEKARAVAGNMTSQCISNVLWGLSKIQYAPPPDLLHALDERLGHVTEDLTTQELSNVLLAHVRLKLTTQNLRGLVDKVGRVSGQFNAQEITNVCWSLTKLVRHDGEVGSASSRVYEGLQPVVEAWAAGQRGEGLTAKGTALALWSLATHGSKTASRTCLHALESRVPEVASDFNAQEASYVLWALARLTVSPRSPALAPLQQAIIAIQNDDASDPRDHDQQHSPSQPARLPATAARRARLAPREASSAVWALAVLRAEPVEGIRPALERAFVERAALASAAAGRGSGDSGASGGEVDVGLRAAEREGGQAGLGHSIVITLWSFALLSWQPNPSSSSPPSSEAVAEAASSAPPSGFEPAMHQLTRPLAHALSPKAIATLLWASVGLGLRAMGDPAILGAASDALERSADEIHGDGDRLAPGDVANIAYAFARFHHQPSGKTWLGAARHLNRHGSESGGVGVPPSKVASIMNSLAVLRVSPEDAPELFDSLEDAFVERVSSASVRDILRVANAMAAIGLHSERMVEAIKREATARIQEGRPDGEGDGGGVNNKNGGGSEEESIDQLKLVVLGIDNAWTTDDSGSDYPRLETSPAASGYIAAQG